jgi:single-stranded DNA-binding protein
MAKGRAVLLEGRLQFDQWTNNENEKRSKHTMNVASFTFLGDGKSNAGDGGKQDGKQEFEPFDNQF